jgi:hypothetical protein
MVGLDAAGRDVDASSLLRPSDSYSGIAPG